MNNKIAESVVTVHIYTHSGYLENKIEKGALYKNKAITLIALIITIIVLLILAGVTLNMVIGENGIFNRAQLAKEETNKNSAKEILKLKILEYNAECSSTDKEVTLKGFKEYLENNEEVEYIKLYKDNKEIIENEVPEKAKIKLIEYNYEFILNDKLEIIEDDKGNTDNASDTVTSSRYLMIEVNEHLENEDSAVINELEIYDKNLNKCEYTVLKDIEYDSTSEDYSTGWTSNLWNYTNLNDGQWAYTSNYPSGAANCTGFLAGQNTSTALWARFVIDLGKELDVGQIKICVGGYDDLSPNKSRVPKEINVYYINNFVNGLEAGSTYEKNIKQRNNNGLTLLKNKQFSDTLLTPTWFELLEFDNSKYIFSRYVLVEVNGILENEDSAVINEIEFYNKYNQKINYKVLSDLEYDSGNNGYSQYWTNGNYWNNTNLNDGQWEYLSNYPTGNQNCTAFLSGDNFNKDSWARFVIDLGNEEYIKEISVYLGGTDELSPTRSRIPREVSFYNINNFVNGTETGSTYEKNIKQRNNEELTFMKNIEMTEILLTATKFNLLNIK